MMVIRVKGKNIKYDILVIYLLNEDLLYLIQDMYCVKYSEDDKDL